MSYKLKAACCVSSSRQWGLTELVARATVSTKHLLSFPWRQDSLIIEGVEKSVRVFSTPPKKRTKCNAFISLHLH